MINDSTLRELDDIAFGANIDDLESYLQDFKYAQVLTNMDRYTPRYLQLYSLLKEIKQDSVIFDTKYDVEGLDESRYDDIFKENPNTRAGIAYGLSSEKLNGLLDTLSIQPYHLVALYKPAGIDIKCVYVGGYFYSASAIGEYNKYIDLTNIFMYNKLVPEFIEELQGVKTADLRGTLTIPDKYKNEQKRWLNIECSVVHYLRLGTNLDKLKVYINNIYTDKSEQTLSNENYDKHFNTQWNKLEFLNSIKEINTVKHALVLDINYDSLSNAILQLDNFFVDSEKDVEDYSIEIRVNSDLKCLTPNLKVVYNSKECDSKSIYESTIKNFNTTFDSEYYYNVLKIVPVHCNHRLVIDSIEVKDAYNIEKYSLFEGKKVRFNVIEGKAVLALNQLDELDSSI